VEVRELSPGDEGLVHRAVRAFRDVDAVAPDLFLEDPRAHAIVALDGEDLLGWAYGSEVLHPEGRWVVIVLAIEVEPSSRRAGVGRALLERFAALASAKGHERVWLLTDAGAEVARRLFPGASVEPSGSLGHWWVFG
jgi:GNAT superfamily N-acetyltransferase